MLLGTIQGVLQTIPAIHDWLRRGEGTGWMVMPFAHAQLNMVAFAILGLVTLSTFALPRVTGRPLFSVPFAKRTLAVIASGIFATYVVFITLGLLETRAFTRCSRRAGQPRGAMDDFLPPDTAIIVRSAVGGDSSIPRWCCWWPAGWGWATSCLCGISPGPSGGSDPAYWDAFRGRTAAAAHQHAMPHPSAVPEDPRQVTRPRLAARLLRGRRGLGRVPGHGLALEWPRLYRRHGPLGVGRDLLDDPVYPAGRDRRRADRHRRHGDPLDRLAAAERVAVYRTYIHGAREILAARGMWPLGQPGPPSCPPLLQGRAFYVSRRPWRRNRPPLGV